MKAYLEKIDKEWLDDFVYISKYPLIERGYKIVPFNGDNPELSFVELGVNPEEDICIGSVEATSWFFKACGVETPKYIGYPESLQKFLGRKIIRMSINDLSENDFPCFIKPANDVKLFTGDIVMTPAMLDQLFLFKYFPHNIDIYKSEIVNFITEYRVFVSHNEIRGIKHYRGDFTKFIDINVVKEMIECYTDCPSAFTLDVGLTKEGKTLLVEVNDMWAIGSYGLDGKTYALLCVRRMKEILNQH